MNNECIICLQQDNLIKLSCCKQRSFHLQCINDWTKINNKCPICRNTIHNLNYIGFRDDNIIKMIFNDIIKNLKNICLILALIICIMWISIMIIINPAIIYKKKSKIHLIIYCLYIITIIIYLIYT
jgi:hypothetical protein